MELQRMRRGLTATLVILVAGLGTAADGNAMSRYLWSSRPLVVFAPDGATAQFARQRAIVRAMAGGFREREVVVIYVAGQRVSTTLGAAPGMTAGQLRRRFGVGSGQFQSILVGKDGGVKLRSGRAISARRLFRLIDSMPMRQQEMRRRR